MASEEFTLDFKTQHEWEWLAVLDFFLAGGGAGLFLLGALLSVEVATLLGVIATALGAIALLVDLGRPERFWRAISNPTTSWISRGALLVSAFLLFGAIHILLWLTGNTGSGLDTAAVVIAAIAAVGVMAYTGFLLSFSPAIPAWHSTLLPIMFIASSLVTAVGAIFLLAPMLDQGFVGTHLEAWKRLGLLLMATDVVLVLAYVATMLSSTLAARQAVRQLTQGSLASAFVGGALVVGLLLPLALVATAYLADIGLPTVKTYLAISGILLVVGGLTLRYSLLRAGVYQPLV